MTKQQPNMSEEPLNLSEILEHLEEWFKDRADQHQSAYGWEGRDLRLQSDLINTVVGAEQDITQLFKYVRDILVKLTEAAQLRDSAKVDANTEPKKKASHEAH